MEESGGLIFREDDLDLSTRAASNVEGIVQAVDSTTQGSPTNTGNNLIGDIYRRSPISTEEMQAATTAAIAAIDGRLPAVTETGMVTTVSTLAALSTIPGSTPTAAATRTSQTVMTNAMGSAPTTERKRKPSPTTTSRKSKAKADAPRIRVGG